MIHLKIEEYGDKTVMFLDDDAQAALDATFGDTLVFSDNTVTVQKASGETGRTFTFRIERPASASEIHDTAT